MFFRLYMRFGRPPNGESMDPVRRKRLRSLCGRYPFFRFGRGTFFFISLRWVRKLVVSSRVRGRERGSTSCEREFAIRDSARSLDRLRLRIGTESVE